MSTTNACDLGAHIFWFDSEDDNPVEGWHTCRECGWKADPLPSSAEKSEK